MSKTEKQHDEATAALYFELAQTKQDITRKEQRVIREAGVKEHRFGQGTRRGWGSEDIYHDFETALDLCKDTELLEALDLALSIETKLQIQIVNMEAQYTGWSRFFLVTSSQGHIHSSMRCSTCYQTTEYGWLPELSGDTEAEVVTTHGPALCTVCFPSAPVEDTGHKITQSRAQELAWSPDRQEKIAQREAREIVKAEAKAKKAANALKTAERNAIKVNEIVDRFGENDQDAYRWTWDVKGYDTAYYIYSDMIRRRRAS